RHRTHDTAADAPRSTPRPGGPADRAAHHCHHPPAAARLVEPPDREVPALTAGLTPTGAIPVPCFLRAQRIAPGRFDFPAGRVPWQKGPPPYLTLNSHQVYKN